MSLCHFSIVLKRNEPEYVVNLPFVSSLTMANVTFSRMAFCFNRSFFNHIYLVDCAGKTNRIVNSATLTGGLSYEKNS